MEYYPLINPAALPKEQRANGLIAISSSSSQQGKQDKSPLPSPQELTCAPPSPSINPPPSSPPRPSSDQNPEPFLATDHGDRCCCVPGTRATLPSVRSRHPCSRVVLIRSFFLSFSCWPAGGCLGAGLRLGSRRRELRDQGACLSARLCWNSLMCGSFRVRGIFE